ncbi:ATP-dependent helicase HrpB [Microbacterium halotolerans]|uniref:ATP-dependent helicase HrpB n=1 Tax=Microbacterium halotolerans TaxID=246613 RepID=UPI000E6A9C5E|nr:ATP-dependent helicase HrpB [Microbacterium halotolerans]
MVVVTTSPHEFDLASIGDRLVVSGARAELEHAAATGAMVVTAPPGTGKTTFVPALVANVLAPRASGRVIVTQPRRVAVRAAARRLAELDGTPLGGAAGFSVRGESIVGADTRVEMVTPGVLLRRLLADPALDGVAAVVLDEVHERSVDGDLLLGMLAEVRELREDLVLIAMSATLDADAVASVITPDGSAPIVDIPSPLHPLAVDYAPHSTPRMDTRGVTRDFLDHVAAVAVAGQADADADALVFVPSARDVDEVVRRIRGRASGVEALPLHGRLPARDQDRATRGRTSQGDAPRIVVSTSLAESSLTVPGVRLVVDAGLSREPRRDAARAMSGLVTVSASRASAEQRAGRAARQGPGRAIRVYSEADHARMPALASPEIQSADLTDAALLLAAWGTPSAVGMRLLTPPPAAAMADAVAALRALELVDFAGRITPLGVRVSRLPTGPREGRALLAATSMDIDVRIAADTVAALSGGFRDDGADLVRLIRELRADRAVGSSRWRADARRLARTVSSENAAGAHGTGTASASFEAPGVVVALARPEWIARRVGAGSRSYVFASGTRAALPDGSPLAASEWIAAWEVQRASGRIADDTGAVIRLAAALNEEDARRAGAGLLKRERTARLESGRVRVRDVERLGAIVLSSTPVTATQADTVPALIGHVREVGIEALPWSAAAVSLRARLSLLHRELGAPWPDMRTDTLLARLDDWLVPVIGSAGASVNGIDTLQALRGMLPWPDAARLEELAPESLNVPSGNRVRITYPDPDDPDGRPVVAVKLQEVFGWARTPRLLDGRVAVLFHLLSPARQPLAVTDDLATFWDGAYREVRRQMRGRYPKHPWPEDPWTAQPTARTTRPLRQ